MSKGKVYRVLFLVTAAGLLWLAGVYHSFEVPGVCIIKHTTGIPCPSCGTTRSVIAILHGDVYAALRWNPMGIPVFLLLFLIPVWIGYDLVAGKATLWAGYRKAETWFRRKQVGIPVLLLVAVNWLWNIYKGL